MGNGRFHPQLHTVVSGNSYPSLSVVVPAYSEEAGIDAFFDRLLPHLDSLNCPYEVIIVDDGSPDATAERVARRHHDSPQIKLIRFSRNFGKEAALSAGLHHAKGDVVVQIDADLQHPPETIAEMLEAWRAGGQVVYAKRRSRESDPLLRRIATRLFYKVYGAISDVKLMEGLGDFILLDRKAVDALLTLAERERFTKGLYAWIGFKRVAVDFDVAERTTGQSSFKLRGLIRFGMDAVTSFGSLPLKVWTYVGVCLAMFGLIYGGFVTIRTMIFGVDVPGFASLMVALCIFSGIQLLGLGLIGEYLSRVVTEVKQRPLFVVDQQVGFEPSDAPEDDTQSQLRSLAS